MTTVTEALSGAPQGGMRSPGLRALVTRAVVDKLLDAVPVRAMYPDGTVRGRGGPGSPALHIARPHRLFDRMSRNPKIGLGEGYMAGDWSVAPESDLAELLTPFAERVGGFVPRPLRRLRRLIDQPLPRRQRNTLEGSRANIQAHYDLSNELFASFLDPSMTYSSALFDVREPFERQTLESAQDRKLQAILDLAGVGAGTRVLEIGSGWGSLALAAGRRGARVTSLTVSEEQLELGRSRVLTSGLQDRIDLRLQDYREAKGEYDAVVSVEMIEAVGEEFWPTYFSTLDRLLAPGGVVAIQAILMPHDRMLATRNSFGWVQKYIFPGGLIPSLEAIDMTLCDYTELQISGLQRFGRHYAETLRRWRRRFNDNWPEIQAHGFDETFRRMWEFYLAYSEAGFASGYLDVAQLQLTRIGR